MEWIKLNVENGSKPADINFKEVIFLAKKTEEKTFIALGCLKSIDGDGLHWDINSGEDIFSQIFTGFKLVDKNEFIPTHYCKITKPLD